MIMGYLLRDDKDLITNTSLCTSFFHEPVSFTLDNSSLLEILFSKRTFLLYPDKDIGYFNINDIGF